MEIAGERATRRRHDGGTGWLLFSFLSVGLAVSACHAAGSSSARTTSAPEAFQVTLKVVQLDSLGRPVATPETAAVFDIIYSYPVDSSLQLDPTYLPWSKSFPARSGTLLQLSAQSDSNQPRSSGAPSITIACVISINGQVAITHSATEKNPAYCRLKI